MSRSRTACGLILFLAGVLSSAATAKAGPEDADQQVSANNAAAISAPAPRRDDDSAQVGAEQSEHNPASLENAGGSSIDVDDPAQTGPPSVEASSGERSEAFIPPAHENRPIGPPNGLFSARPVDAEGSRSEKSTPRSAFSLETFDPRRNGVLRVVGSLAVVIGLLLTLRGIARRLAGPLSGGRRPSGVAEVLARFPLGRRQQLVLLKLGRRILVLHQTPQSMSALSEISDPDEVAHLLGRIEAGAERRSTTFQETLLRQSGERTTAASKSKRRPRAGRDAFAGNEVVDLTRSPGGRLGRLFGRREL